MLTWVHASYAVCLDMKIHNGGAMSLGWVLIHCRSSKQKLNTKGSTEAEFIKLGDYVPFDISMRIFMES